MAWQEPEHRHTLTPIGDELEMRGKPLEPGKPSLLDDVERDAEWFRGLIPRPRTLKGRIALRLTVFGIVLGALAGAVYGIGVATEGYWGRGHDHSELIAFLIAGVCVGSTPLIIVPFGRISMGMWYWPRNPQKPERQSDDEEELDQKEEAHDMGTCGKYGIWEQNWVFWVTLGACLVVIGFAAWGR
jgi:hypothetical protein